MRYLDTSAFLKVLVEEECSADARRALDGVEVWSSVLLDVEAHRAARRLGVPAEDVARCIEAVTLVTVGDDTITTARTIGSEALRALDALHLATALELGADLDAVVTYDRRLAEAADRLGMTVEAPGLTAHWWE